MMPLTRRPSILHHLLVASLLAAGTVGTAEAHSNRRQCARVMTATEPETRHLHNTDETARSEAQFRRYEVEVRLARRGKLERRCGIKEEGDLYVHLFLSEAGKPLPPEAQAALDTPEQRDEASLGVHYRGTPGEDGTWVESVRLVHIPESGRPPRRVADPINFYDAFHHVRYRHSNEQKAEFLAPDGSAVGTSPTGTPYELEAHVLLAWEPKPKPTARAPELPSTGKREDEDATLRARATAVISELAARYKPNQPAGSMQMSLEDQAIMAAYANLEGTLQTAKDAKLRRDQLDDEIAADKVILRAKLASLETGEPQGEEHDGQAKKGDEGDQDPKPSLDKATASLQDKREKLLAADTALTNANESVRHAERDLELATKWKALDTLNAALSTTETEHQSAASKTQNAKEAEDRAHQALRTAGFGQRFALGPAGRDARKAYKEWASARGDHQRAKEREAELGARVVAAKSAVVRATSEVEELMNGMSAPDQWIATTIYRQTSVPIQIDIKSVPLVELSLVSHPGAVAVTHLQCRDLVGSNAATTDDPNAGVDDGYCADNPTGSVWMDSIYTAPLGLRTRIAPSPDWPALGVSTELSTVAIGDSGWFSDTVASDAEPSPGVVTPFAASTGFDLQTEIGGTKMTFLMGGGLMLVDSVSGLRPRWFLGFSVSVPITTAKIAANGEKESP